VKRAILLIVGVGLLSTAFLSAAVKPAPDTKHAAPQAGAQAQPGQLPATHDPTAPPAGSKPEPAAESAHAPEGASPAEATHPGEQKVEHEAGEAESAESPWATVARLFNFALLAGALVYLLRSPFGAFLEGRQAQIRKSLTDAAATREEASRQVALIDQKLQALPSELEALKRRGEAEIAAEEERIRQAAEVERQRMVESGKREIERRGQLAERQLLHRAGELAVSLATERVKRTITDADQARLVDRYLEQVRPETIGS
jgi:F0F1-type ATP synthase membrane subunit b/b'